jgi:hypothetical protein
MSPRSCDSNAKMGQFAEIQSFNNHAPGPKLTKLVELEESEPH